MRPLRFLSVFALPALLLGITLGAAMGQEPPPSPTDSTDSQILPPQVQRRVLNLVTRRMYDEVDDATGVALDDELRALTKDETRLFLDFSFVIQKIGFSDANPANAESMVPMPRQRYILSLIERALYGDTTGGQLGDEIASLSEAEHALYLKLSEAIQQVLSPSQAAAYLPADLVALRNAILCVMDKEGVSSFMDINLSEDEIKQAAWECGYSPPQPTSSPAPAREER